MRFAMDLQALQDLFRPLDPQAVAGADLWPKVKDGVGLAVLKIGTVGHCRRNSEPLLKSLHVKPWMLLGSFFCFCKTPRRPS